MNEIARECREFADLYDCDPKGQNSTAALFRKAADAIENSRFSFMNCYIEPKPSDFTEARPFASIKGLDGYAIVPRETYDAIKAERDKLKAHAEAMASNWYVYADCGSTDTDCDEAALAMQEAYIAYRRDFPREDK